MLSSERQRAILEKLRTEGRVLVADLAAGWGVSEDSIRRDLRDLAEGGLIQRVHGGALPASAARGSYRLREPLDPEIKARLGRAAAGLIRPGTVVGIDGGTTTLQLARSLPRDLELTVVTHSPLIAAALADHVRIEVLILGGRLFRHSLVALGAETVEALGRLRLDQFFLGATGLREETGVTTGDAEDAAVKRAFCRQSAEVILPVSTDKWGAAAPFQIVPWSELTAVVVPSELHDPTLETWARRGVSVVQA